MTLDTSDKNEEIAKITEPIDHDIKSANLFEHGNSPYRKGLDVRSVLVNANQEATTSKDSIEHNSDELEAVLDVNQIARQIHSFSASLATFEKEWNSIIERYSNAEDQGDVIDLANGTIVKNNGHIELLEDEEDTIWDSVFPKSSDKSQQLAKQKKNEPGTPSLLEQLGMNQSESESEPESLGEQRGVAKGNKRRRTSLWEDL